MHLLLLAFALSLVQTVPLEGDTHHVQGIAIDGSRLFVTSVDRPARKGFLSEYDLASGRRLRTVELQQDSLFHPGGIDQDDSSLWIPVAEDRPGSRTVIQRRAKETLALLSSFGVPDHIGALAVSSTTLFLVNWDARQIYTFSLDGHLIARRANPNSTRYQDIKYRYGALVASGLHARPANAGAVEWLDPATLLPLQSEPLRRTDRGVPYTAEGMDLRDGLLYLLPEDAPSRLFIFRLES